VRRWLSVCALGLTLLGIELSTEVISLFFARLSAGATAVAAGVELQISANRYLAGVAAMVIGIGMALLATWIGVAARSVGTTGDRCPSCRADTRRVKRRWTDKLLSALLGHRVTRRHCGECGWTGLSHRY
jgi:hypothetical protein